MANDIHDNSDALASHNSFLIHGQSLVIHVGKQFSNSQIRDLSINIFFRTYMGYVHTTYLVIKSVSHKW